jgi:eukaryotic-like serine/threonine-protein kinase
MNVACPTQTISNDTSLQPASRSTFAKNALASGLVTGADLEDALARLRDGTSQATDPGPAIEAAGDGQPTDERLADQLVTMGRLNRYQASQLLSGFTKLTLGPYRIVDSIGQGGMGQVFRAQHSVMGRTVAVKVLPKNKSTPEAIACFTREIRAQAALDHENLVRALDAGHDGNVYFLVCEYVPGADLRRYVRDRGPLGMAEAATIISQAAQGLQHAHHNGLIHRDVKPANLLVTPEGLTKVSDLGLVGSLRDSDSDPRAGKVVGTADYLAPEHITAPRSITPTSDLYSLGCTLYYAVTGKVPFPGGNAREKARRHCEDTPFHPRVLNPSLSEPFVEVIAAMMEKDPAKRIATAAEVVERLQPWAGESVSSPRNPDEAQRLRDGDFELDSGGGELVDTSVSFEFDLASAAHGENRKQTSATLSVPARRLITATPIPAKPLVGPPPSGPIPLGIAASLPPPLPRKRRNWTISVAIALVAAAAIASAATLIAQLVRD